jgi:DNA invertase Pin-like site-specific DNA recombinase
MKKAVLLVRVSTEYQEYEAQTNELVAFAKRDGGYSNNELEIIQDKESGTKLSDEERQGLTKLYAAINDPDNRIECVYAWEISRLSRIPSTLHKLKEKLVEKKINLKTKQENFVLLNDLKEQIPNSEILFSVYVGLCKSEIDTKQARFKRTKQAKAMRGGYIGGNIRYGYFPNSETKVYEIHPEQGEVVRLLFELYSTGKYGFSKLHVELLRRGKSVNIRLIEKILKNGGYTGETIPEKQFSKKINGKETPATRYARIYPPIVSKELFEKCRVVASKNNTNVDKSHNIYFGSKLIKCNDCGSNLVALKHKAEYRCMNHYNPMIKKDCSSNDSININVIDSILWYEASWLESIFRINLSDKQVSDWNSRITELQSKVDNSDKQYETDMIALAHQRG